MLKKKFKNARLRNLILFLVVAFVFILVSAEELGGLYSERENLTNTTIIQKANYTEPIEKVLRSVRVSGDNPFNSKSYKFTLTGNEINYDIQTEMINGKVKVKVISPDIKDYDVLNSTKDKITLIEKEDVFNVRKIELENQEYEKLDPETQEPIKDNEGKVIKEKIYEEVFAVKKEITIYEKIPLEIDKQITYISKKIEGDKYVYEFEIDPKTETHFKLGENSIESELTADLVAYYKLDETSGVWVYNAEGNSSYNGTASHVRIFTSEIVGMINTGADFTQGDDFILLNSAPVTADGEKSISYWFKTPSTLSGTYAIISTRPSGSTSVGFGFQVYFVSGSTSKIMYFHTGKGDVSKDVTLSTNTWYNVVVTTSAYSGGMTVKLYLNGEELTDLAGSITGSRLDGNFWIGRQSTAYANSYIDEISMFDRIINSTEVSFLYGSGTPPSYPFNPSMSPPSATLNIPINNSYEECEKNVNFNCSASDNLNLKNVTWYLWNSTGSLVNSSSINLTGVSNSTIFINNFTYFDNYTWNCLFYDNDSNLGWANDNYTLKIIFSNLTILNPTNLNPTNTSNGSKILINFLYQENNINITSGINLESILIGGQEAVVVSSGTSATYPLDYEDFEGYSEGTQPNPIGNWTQATFDTDNWYVYTGDGESTSTGPTADYDGYYAMVETSDGYCTRPDTAVLYRSPEIDFDNYNIVNVSFAYNMYGSTMGTLHIKENSTGTWLSVWNKTGDQGTSWYTTEVSLTGKTGTGSIAIWMNCGSAYTSDAAVDSVNITAYTTEEFAWIDGIGWQVNVTAPNMTDGLKDLFLNLNSNSLTINDTQTNAIQYGLDGGDSCAYTSGNWIIDCSDNCLIDSPVDLGGNNISIIGTGTFITTANITNFNNLYIKGTDSSNICRVTCSGGGCFR